MTSDAGPPAIRPTSEGGTTERVAEREAMVRSTIAARGVRSPEVLAAMRRVPRHRFVPDAFRGEAYADRPLPIGHGQTISQPYVVAFMTEAVRLKPTDRCLEIGTGSGYQAAVLAELCREVYSIELLPELGRFAEENLRREGYGPERVKLRVGDGWQGWEEAAPFEAIVVTAAPDRVPPRLLEQLAVGGRLIVPVGPRDRGQELELWTRRRAGDDPSAFERETLLDVRFVPLVEPSDVGRAR